MRYLSLTAVLILSAGLASTAGASEIYKWTDAEGNVHYTDKPMDPSFQQLAMVSRPTDNARVQAQTQTRLDRQAAAAEEPDSGESSGDERCDEPGRPAPDRTP